MNEFDIDSWMADLKRIYTNSIGIAEGLGVTPAAVSHWRVKRTIPADKQLQLYILHPDVFTLNRMSEDALPPRMRKPARAAA